MTACALHPEQLSTVACARCQTPVCAACESKLDGASYCKACVEALARLLAPAANASAGRLGVGVAAAAAAGLLGALAWYGVVVASDFKLGLLAVAIGWLIGFAAMKASRGSAPALPWITVAIALASMLFGEYLIVNHFVKIAFAAKYPEATAPAFISLPVFAEVYAKTFSPMDILFYGIGAYEAYKLPAKALRQ